MVTDLEAESASTDFTLPNQRTSFLWGLYNFDEKKSHGNKQYRQNILHAVSVITKLLYHSLQHFRGYRDFTKALSKVWVLIKAMMDMSLSLTSPFIRKPGPMEKRKAEGRHQGSCGDLGVGRGKKKVKGT